jgi:hypothetical protein
MFRIDSDGATINNRFTEGNPQTSVPATVVSADWANSVQEEIIKTIEEMGIVLSKPSEQQHWLALLELFLRGGRKLPVAHTLANNTAATAVTGFPVLNKSNHLCRVAFYYIERKTTTQSKQEAGILISRYNSKDNNWDQQSLQLFDDSGSTFSIDNTNTDAAILKVATDDLTGASYVGTLKMTQLFEIRV